MANLGPELLMSPEGLLILLVLEARWALRRSSLRVDKVIDAVLELAKAHPDVDEDELEDELEEARAGLSPIDRLMGRRT